ncbi:hypothetical protein GW17_00047867, partial [Ensete ventricosum]
PSSDSAAPSLPTVGLAAVFPTQAVAILAATHRSQPRAPLPHPTMLPSSRASLPLGSAQPVVARPSSLPPLP